MPFQETCPDCGTTIGCAHFSNCDVERCSVCGGQWINCQCQDHKEMDAVWTGEWPIAKPSFIGVPVLARHNPNGQFAKDNLYFRTALSDEEARKGIEIYIGAELRKRMLELEQQGVIEIPDEGHRKLNTLVDGEQST